MVDQTGRRDEQGPAAIAAIVPDVQDFRVMARCCTHTIYTTDITHTAHPYCKPIRLCEGEGGVSFARHRPRTCLLRKYTYTYITT